MPVSEFFGEDTTGSGVLGLLLSKNQNATLSSLPQDMTNAVTSATIGELTENGLLNFPADTEENLNKIFRGESWKNMPLTNLITALVEIAAQSVA